MAAVCRSETNLAEPFRASRMAAVGESGRSTSVQSDIVCKVRYQSLQITVLQITATNYRSEIYGQGDTFLYVPTPAHDVYRESFFCAFQPPFLF